jgi:hypothetical protein
MPRGPRHPQLTGESPVLQRIIGTVRTTNKSVCQRLESLLDLCQPIPGSRRRDSIVLGINEVGQP